MVHQPPSHKDTKGGKPRAPEQQPSPEARGTLFWKHPRTNDLLTVSLGVFVVKYAA